MSKTDKQRYNLVFAGQLLPGTDRQRAQRTLAAFFGIDDPAAVAPFFSGKAVPLRRDLRHDDAMRLYRQLRSVGLICEVPRSRPDPATASQNRQRGTRRPTAPPARPSPSSGQQEGPADEFAALEARHRDSLARRNPLAVPAHRVGLREPEVPADDAAPTAPPPVARQTQAPPSPQAADARSRATVPGARPRGAAPNQFALRPSLFARQAREQAEQLRVQAAIAAAIAGVLCLIVAAVTLRFPAAPAGPEPIGPLAATSRDSGELILLLPQALMLHARSGLPRARIAAADFGLAAFAPPLMSVGDDAVIVGARSGSEDLRLLRCQLETLLCATVIETGEHDGAPAIAQSYLGDTLFLQFPDGTLLRATADGGIEVEAASVVPSGRPVLRYVDGLLLLPAADGPLLGVHRPDTNGFGEQLDALFLAPADAGGDFPTAIEDVAATADARWAILLAASGERHLYRFDRQWGAGHRVNIDVSASAYLVPWRDRLLLADPSSAAARRIAPDGLTEADFESSLLRDAHAEWRQTVDRRALLRRVGVILPLVLIGLAAGAALLTGAAARGLAALPQVSTGLLDPLPAGIHWLPDTADRERRAGRVGTLLMLSALVPAAALLATGSWRAAACLLPAVLAGVHARSAATRGLGGHLGLRQREAIVVDHDGRYFFGSAAALRSGAGLLFAPGVALPLAIGGIANIDARDLPLDTIPRLDAASCAGLLWHYRHPWFVALIVTAAGWMLAAAALALTF